ncbi:MAG: SgcJ/EcaC family oxidoreductase [Proteobacteria bacterium]|nr:SgcJ/EcaC family oxidoreductase [Pseudomonadota bacterium]
MLFIVLAGCGNVHECSRDAPSIEAVSAAWKQAFNARDAEAVAKLYAPDAILAAPGLAPVRGREAIAAYFRQTVAGFASAGVTVADAPMGASGTSGNLGYDWKTYVITNASGTVVDRGKLLTLYRRDHGHWLISGDTWNSDLAPPRAP